MSRRPVSPQPVSPRLARATEFMKRAHDAAGQKRKGGAPYWTHPLAVRDVLADELGVTDEDAQVASLLHDVVEDTPTTLVTIEAEFGPAVAGMVKTLSKPKLREGLSDELKASNKAVMLAAYYAGLRAAPAVVRQIKIADRVHNLRDMAGAGPAFVRRYLPDTVELMAVLEGTPGMDLLRAEYAKAEAEHARRQGPEAAPLP